MSTSFRHDGQSVLAVWVNGALPHPPVSGFAFTKAVRLPDLGAMQQKRCLLSPESKCTVITDSTSCRHSCNVIYLDAAPMELSRQFKQC